jgi:alpha-mannosidase
VNVQDPEATYEIPYGHIIRPANGEEEPGQNWIDVTGMAETARGRARYGLSILNDSVYSFDVQGSDMRLSILRSPVYAHHTPTRLDPGQDYWYTDQGVHAFTYVLLPHLDGWREAGTARAAQVLNALPVALVEHVHDGDLPPVARQLHVEDPNVIVSAVKKREDADEIVLRCYETSGRSVRTKVEVSCLERTFDLVIGPSQIRTFIVPREKSQPVRETSFLEE